MAKSCYTSNFFFTYITTQSFLVNALMVGGGWELVVLLLLKKLNSTLSSAGTRRKHNYLDSKVYPEG